MANNLAYGFIGLEHLFEERPSEAQIPQIYTAVQESVAEHNRQVEEILSLHVQPTTSYTERFYQKGNNSLQPATEWSTPDPIRPRGFYDVAYPIGHGMTGWGTNRISRALMTVEEMNRSTLDVLDADSDWLKRYILSTLLFKGSYTFEDQDKGSLTVHPLANGDSVTYPKWSQTPATDNHYLAQTGDIGATDDLFQNIYDDLVEHPENRGGQVVAYVNDDEVSAVEAMSNFREVQDPDILPSDDSARLTGTLSRGFGDEVIGKVDKVWVVRWSWVPANYVIGTVRGARLPLLKMRQYPSAQLQGLQRVEHDNDGNLREMQFYRDAGFGVFNRVGAVIHQINGDDTTYDNPTNYDPQLFV